MKLLMVLAKFFLALAIWTAIGQVPIKGEPLENKYHRVVNSPTFQKYFWTVATPVTWTKDQIEKLIESRRLERSQAR